MELCARMYTSFSQEELMTVAKVNVGNGLWGVERKVQRGEIIKKRCPVGV
jgi:hypothetical protein